MQSFLREIQIQIGPCATSPVICRGNQLSSNSNLTNIEHGALLARVAQMSVDEKERVFVQNANIDSFTQEMNVSALRDLLEEWRGLREAVNRIQRKCRECS